VFLTGINMAAKKKKKTAKKAATGEMIISKSRTKAAVQECNISQEFYSALDQKVRELIGSAESRALDNKRRTLRPYDL